MTRWLLTGAGGQLATHALALLSSGGAEVVALGRGQLDITDASAVDAAVAEYRPDVVLNAAAYTAVDAAETDETAAALVNEAGPRLLASALARQGGRLIHVSTDYVFAGTATRPYSPGDPTGPRSAYGRTKLAGELAVRNVLGERAHIVRTAWVYGGPGPNFLDTMTGLEKTRDTLDVVNDQTGCPTYVGDLAGALVALGSYSGPGATWHYVNSGQATWFDFTREIFRLLGADPARVRPTDSSAYQRPAPRPAWSVLSTEAWTAAGLPAPRTWQESLAEAVAARPSQALRSDEGSMRIRRQPSQTNSD